MLVRGSIFMPLLALVPLDMAAQTAVSNCNAQLSAPLM